MVSQKQARPPISRGAAVRFSARRGCQLLLRRGGGRVCGPNRSTDRSVRPTALHLRIETDSAAGARGNLQPDSQFAGATWAAGTCDWNVQKCSNNRCEEPEIEQKRSEHPETIKYAQGMFGIEAHKAGSQNNHQEPSQAASNFQLPLEVLPHTHVRIVRASTIIRSLSRPCDVT